MSWQPSYNNTSYELVEWLAGRLHEMSDRMAQEHKDRIMIQKSLVGAVEPEEQQEVGPDRPTGQCQE